LAGAILAAAAGVTRLSAQSVLSDPKDAPKVFASTCSACHKSPQGLAKSGQVAGFLRQHYTTGAEMSAAMAAYLVAAGNAPAGKKGAATVSPGDEGEAKAKAREAREKAKEAREKKKQERLAAAHPAGEGAGAAAAEKQKPSLRGKQRTPAKQQEPETAVRTAPAEPPAASPASPAVKPAEPSAEEQKQTAAVVQPAPAAAAPQPGVTGLATTGMPGQVELNIPPPPMPEAAPPELSQSAFSSSPLP
jgi:hypothetical protein